MPWDGTAASEGKIIKPFNAYSFSSQNLQLYEGANQNPLRVLSVEI